MKKFWMFRCGRDRFTALDLSAWTPIGGFSIKCWTPVHGNDGSYRARQAALAITLGAVQCRSIYNAGGVYRFAKRWEFGVRDYKLQGVLAQ